ncbi:hypothetical protein MM326_13905 [Alkalihalobacillus sp. LMS6]|jgi:hypothetical protein|uniref:hypothetical protein n=1 Tax=Alkalihalobacillus sp. LMS6 TaxID=2924034 RepID=UPI0020D063E9|nr:hypothetical protein [Alkalihalobacillus sp. LMS6]UTR05197.1 hypothetical protein MM326_13905 [Alkalihalobacillus sp. LMS6]
MKLRYLLGLTALAPVALIARNYAHRRKLDALYEKARGIQAEMAAIEVNEGADEPGWTVIEIELADPYDGFYAVGDPVVIINPYLHANYREPEHGIVTDRCENEHGAYIYRVSGQDGWLNENWLDYDDYGPKLLTLTAAPTKTFPNDEVAVDYWLETLSGAKATGDAREYEAATEALAEISRRREGA